MIVIDDANDPRLAPLRLNERQLSNRPQRRDDAGDGLFLAEGDLVVARALAAGCRAVLALVDAQRPPSLVDRLAVTADVYAGGERIRQMVTQLGMPHSVVALFERPPRPTVAEVVDRATRLVLVEAVDNPVNVGSIIRNAAGLGWDGLVLDRTSADPLARRSLRVSMGHALHLPHARTDDLAATVTALVAEGWNAVTLTPAADAVDLADVPDDQPKALVVGAERAGLSFAVQGAARHRARIPMHGGVDSLNVAAATAIACYVLR